MRSPSSLASKKLGQVFFQKTGKDEGNQFLFVLLSVFLCALVAQLIGVENIIGAFLAGLAINSIIGDGPVKEKNRIHGQRAVHSHVFCGHGAIA